MDTREDSKFLIFKTALIVFLGAIVLQPILLAAVNILYLCAVFVEYCALIVCIGYAIDKIRSYGKRKKLIAVLFILGGIALSILSFSHNTLLFIPIYMLGGIIAGCVCREFKETWYWYIYLAIVYCFGRYAMLNVSPGMEMILDYLEIWLYVVLFFWTAWLIYKVRKGKTAKWFIALKMVIIAAMICFIALLPPSMMKLIKTGGGPLREEPRTYEGASDVEQMQIFLKQMASGKQSAEKNIDILGWDIEDPTTWDGVVFDGGDIISIDLKGRGIGGRMELIYFDKLKILDVSDNPDLIELDCSYNKIETLDVSGNTGLSTLNCGGNLLKTIDVSENINLERFSCRGNLLTSLDVSKNTKLGELYCYDNMITELDLSNNNMLVILYCGGNPIKSIDVSGHKYLVRLNCDDSKDLMEIDVRDCTWLQHIYCWNTSVGAENIYGVESDVALLFDYKDGFVNYKETRPADNLIRIILVLSVISFIIDCVSLISVNRSETKEKIIPESD